MAKEKTTGTTTNTGQSGDTKKIKKRIFYPNRYYLVDKDNIILKVTANVKDWEDLPFEDTDTILIATHPNMLFKREPKVEEIVLDFVNKQLTIKGDSCILNKVEYEGNATYDLEPEELNDWQELLSDCKKKATTFRMIGKPPLTGEIFDAE